MRTSLALLFIFAAAFHQYSAAQSLSGEAKTREDDCGGLVSRKPTPSPRATSPSSSTPSPSSPSSSPSPSSPASSTSGAPTSPAPTGQGQCQWVCNGATGASSGATGGVTAGVTSGATGGVSGGATGGASGGYTQGYGGYDCELTEAWWNMTYLLSAQQQSIWIQFIEEVENTILIDVTLTDIQKVSECSLAFENFCSVNVDIYDIVAFEFIGSWGMSIDFMYIHIDLQASITTQIVTFDSSGSCILFDALLNATEGNSQQYQAVLVLIEQLKVDVFENTQLTSAQQYAECYLIFVQFFAEYSQWESFFFSIQIEGFGAFQSFFDVCHGYHEALTISVVLSGSSDSDCVLLGALTAAESNTSYTITVRNQIKQLHDVLLAYFQSETDVSLRLQYVSSECYQMFVVEGFEVKFIDTIDFYFKASGSSSYQFWGTWYDLLWCSQFCKNSGKCGNLDDGMGTSVAPSTTQAVAVCSKRKDLIVIDSSNATILTTVLQQNYNTWNITIKSAFNTYFNKIKSYIWNSTLTSDVQCHNITTAFEQFSANNKNEQDIVMNIEISQWPGTVRQFCDCDN